MFYPKVELAQEIVKSELLVSEDEDFINNFILSEDTLEEYKKAGESGGSVLGDVLLFSGSLAAVAGITTADSRENCIIAFKSTPSLPHFAFAF